MNVSLRTSSQDRLVGWLAPRRRSILLAMLVLLHVTLLEGVGGTMDRLMMVVHIGLFFLWQPFVRTQRRLAPLHLALVGAIIATMLLLLGPALLLLWVMLLAGIIGGKVFVLANRWNRLFHLAALAYLVAALLIFLLPQLLPPTVVISAPLHRLAPLGLPIVFVVMLAMPGERVVQERPEMIDFAYSVLVFLLLAVLVLGSVAGMLLTGLGYFDSLLVVLLLLAAVLLFLSWFWNPRGGFSGMGAFVSRYLLSVSLPFELWVEALASYPSERRTPQEFVAWACDKLIEEAVWINGVRWWSATDRGIAGTPEGHAVRFREDALSFEVYAAQPLTPTLIWQFNLLLQLLGEFYVGRMREQQLRELGYLQAIYETGSRLTHDVKNILQSLNALCVAAETEKGAASPEFQGLIRRQLPAIAQRLRQTLDKLGRPNAEHGAPTPAEAWWKELQDRFAGRDIRFEAVTPLAGRTLPAALFSSAVENLLQNALEKRQMHPELAIEARLLDDAAGLVLEVCDDGHAIPAGVAEELGMSPMRSNNGLGIGLYQVARLAAAVGYRLQVRENRAGRVCLRLSPAGAAQN